MAFGVLEAAEACRLDRGARVLFLAPHLKIEENQWTIYSS
jgi:hypothetical protein